jgi:hypothetical protein
MLNEDLGRPLQELLGMHDGKGATDCDLYGDFLGKQYREVDARVISDAENELDQKRDPSTIVHHKVELHFFPRTKQRRWVFVTKRPWLSADKREILGVHVSFHDIHEWFCLEGMIGRWLSCHLPRSIQGTVRTHRSTPHPIPTPKPHGRRAPADLRLQALETQILNWLRNLICGNPLRLAPNQFRLTDLRWLEPVLQEIYRSISLEFVWPRNDQLKLKGEARLLEAVILVLVMNAYDASDPTDYERKCAHIIEPNGTICPDTRPKVTVELVAATDDISVEVRDKGRGFSAAAAGEIGNGEKLNADGKPGSGLFLLRQFARALQGRVSVESPGEAQGATARFACSKQAFQDLSSKEFLDVSDAANLGEDSGIVRIAV